MSKPLFRSTIVIWSEFDPTTVELSRLAWEADQGEAYCSDVEVVRVEDPFADDHPPSADFFEVLEDDSFGLYEDEEGE